MHYKRCFKLLLVILILLPFYSFSQNAFIPPIRHKTIVIAHRGDHTHAPENTLAAYQNAIDDGADFVEIDLRQTKDNQLVIMHNDNILKMTGFDAEVKNMLFDSLRLKKVRDPFYTKYGLFDIPTFKEVLTLCKGKINIYLDFKEANTEQTFKEIYDAGMQNNVVVYINEPHQYNEWKTIAPMMPLIISLPDEINTAISLRNFLNTISIDILDGNAGSYNSEIVAAATEKNIPVWADIQADIETEDMWNTALSLGLAGLQTNHPKALIDFLIKKGIR